MAYFRDEFRPLCFRHDRRDPELKPCSSYMNTEEDCNSCKWCPFKNKAAMEEAGLL